MQNGRSLSVKGPVIIFLYSAIQQASVSYQCSFKEGTGESRKKNDGMARMHFKEIVTEEIYVAGLYKVNRECFNLARSNMYKEYIVK